MRGFRDLLAVMLVVAAIPGGPGVAQDAGASLPPAPPILTLDQDRLFDETLYGRRIKAEIEEISADLAERNRVLTAELPAEERDLTEKRATLTPDAFRPLAEAFDAKVTGLREEQDARILALQRRRDLERRGFTARVLPMLSNQRVALALVL